MKRIGKYTGRVYSENVDVSEINECCQCCTEEPTQEEINKAKLSCFLCPGDPMSLTKTYK